MGLIRKLRWRDFAQKRWVVLQEMFVGEGLDSHSLGEGRCRSLMFSEETCVIKNMGGGLLSCGS